jgi:hypothetical protein
MSHLPRAKRDTGIPVGYVGFSLAFPLEQFLAPNPLAIAAIANPSTWFPFRAGRAILVFGHDAL